MSTGRCPCDTPEPHPVSECIPPWRTPTEVQQEDLRLILESLRLHTGARPYSPHSVVHREVLPAIEALHAKVARVEVLAEGEGNSCGGLRRDSKGCCVRDLVLDLRAALAGDAPTDPAGSETEEPVQWRACGLGPCCAEDGHEGTCPR